MDAGPLETPPPEIGIEQAARIARETFALDGALTPLASERDRNFRVDTRSGSYVLKVHNPADRAALVEFQSLALRHVALVDPSLPIVREVASRTGEHAVRVRGSDGRDSLARVFGFLPGHNPAAEDLDERALFAWGAATARLGRALRGFFHPAADYPIQWDVLRAPRLRPLLDRVGDAEQRSVVTEVLDRFDANVAPVAPSLRAQVVHDDMSLDNVLVDERGRITGIVDFGDMTHTALVCDLAVALADVLDGRPDALEMAEPMIAGYRSVTALEPLEASLLGDLVATRCTTAIVVGAWRHGVYPDNDYLATFGGGAWRMLELVRGEGFGAVARRLEHAGERGRLPYRASRSAELSERRRHLMGPAPLSYATPLHLVRGEGVWLFDADGRRFLDCYNNVPVVGHAHPRVAAAVAEQARRLSTNTRYLHEAIIELTERLLATMPSGIDRALFVNSGSEANDVAWRIATFATGRRGAIATRFAYHGVTEATTDVSPEEWPGGRVPERVRLVDAPDGYRGAHRRDGDPEWAPRYADDVERAAAELEDAGTPLAAMILDGAFTSDGVLGPVPAYVLAASRRVRDAGGVFVADEVQAGHGRLGEQLWSFAAAGVDADLVTLGKPMGNGFPVAAVLSRSELVDPFVRATGFFSTFGGNPVACAAALAVLDVLDDEDLIGNAARTGASLADGLRALASRHDAIGDVRGQGLLAGVEIVSRRDLRTPDPREAARIVEALRDHGVLIGVTGPDENVLKIRPPLVFARVHADALLDALDEVLARRP